MTQSIDWTGQVGDVWAQQWRRTDRSLSRLSMRLDTAIAAASPIGPFRALDIGCGAGATSLALLAARHDASVIGIDLSHGLLDIARHRMAEAGVSDRIRFLQGDAASLAAQHGFFDLLMSRHGLMFFDDPRAAFAALHRAARPAARLVFSCFRDWQDNDFYTSIAHAVDSSPPAPAAPGPFAFADRGHVAAILADAGWQDAVAETVDFAYRVGEGPNAVDDATDFLARIGPAAARLREASEAERPAIRARVRAVLAENAAGDTIDLRAAAWIWTARA